MNLEKLTQKFQSFIAKEIDGNCFDNHFDEWEFYLQDYRKGFEFHIKCPICDKKFCEIWIGKTTW